MLPIIPDISNSIGSQCRNITYAEPRRLQFGILGPGGRSGLECVVHGTLSGLFHTPTTSDRTSSAN